MEYNNSRLSGFRFTVAILALTAMAACGRAQGEGIDTGRSEATSTEGSIPICKLLTAQEVSAVLPKHDGGMQVASGESLSKNIKNYQCSYTFVRGTDADLLTVIVLVASDSAAFRFIKPNPSSKQDNFPIFRQLEMGDGAVLYGKPGDIQVETWSGMTVVSLELMAPEAERRADAMVRLASVVAAKVGGGRRAAGGGALQ